MPANLPMVVLHPEGRTAPHSGAARSAQHVYARSSRCQPAGDPPDDHGAGEIAAGGIVLQSAGAVMLRSAISRTTWLSGSRGVDAPRRDPRQTRPEVSEEPRECGLDDRRGSPATDRVRAPEPGWRSLDSAEPASLESGRRPEHPNRSDPCDRGHHLETDVIAMWAEGQNRKYAP